MNTECAICLETFDEEEALKIILPCDHKYHDQCFNELRQNNFNKCSICNKKFRVLYTFHCSDILIYILFFFTYVFVTVIIIIIVYLIFYGYDDKKPPSYDDKLN
jgi:hypothetical protein